MEMFGMKGFRNSNNQFQNGQEVPIKQKKS